MSSSPSVEPRQEVPTRPTVKVTHSVVTSKRPVSNVFILGRDSRVQPDLGLLGKERCDGDGRLCSTEVNRSGEETPRDSNLSRKSRQMCHRR